MMTLENLYQENIDGQSKLLERLSNRPESISINTYLNLWFCQESFAVKKISEKDNIGSKIHFNICGLLDEFLITKFNDRLLDYGIHHICLAILSDNEPFIQRYAKLRYHTTYIDGRTDQVRPLTMDEMVLKGESAIGCNTIQFFMENNMDGIERNLNLYEVFKTKILRMGKTVELDFEFFKALHFEDKTKMEELLEKLVSPKVLKRKFDNPILNKFIALPALGYAKLAWRKGIEVEVNSPLVPKELLPIKPLDNYEIPYDFLRETV